GRIVAAKAAGYELDTAPDFGMRAPEIAPAWLPEEPYAAFFHGTARAAKKWADENWIALGAFMNAQG
ncbi:MAG: waaC, partial [Paucimonas sp.]|nr:waaC [Paucimonas sp.]